MPSKHLGMYLMYDHLEKLSATLYIHFAKKKEGKKRKLHLRLERCVTD
jgi:hypothetical protein